VSANGVEAIRHLKSLPKNVIIIVVFSLDATQNTRTRTLLTVRMGKEKEWQRDEE
jgi:hypothetical protein